MKLPPVYSGGQQLTPDADSYPGLKPLESSAFVM